VWEPFVEDTEVIDLMDWSNSTVLITGAASGIGACAARRLARTGAVVGIVDVDDGRLATVLAECKSANPRCAGWHADLGDLDLAERVALEAWDSIGPIDVLINNAAMPSRGRVTEVPRHTIEQVMRVNFLAPAQMTVAILPGMLRRHSGTIVNVASIAGRIGAPAMSTDAASKFALCGWTESIALDLWNTGVRVRLVNPGPVDTEFWLNPINAHEPYDGPLVPVSDAVDVLLDAIGDEAFECFIPPEMRTAVDWKNRNIDEFLSSMVTMLTAQGKEPREWACAESWDHDTRLRR
jgi:short-subunit dehydrogenase